MSFMQGVYDSVKGRGARVVYAEGLEERAIRASRWLVDHELLVPVLAKGGRTRDRLGID